MGVISKLTKARVRLTKESAHVNDKSYVLFIKKNILLHF